MSRNHPLLSFCNTPWAPVTPANLLPNTSTNTSLPLSNIQPTTSNYAPPTRIHTSGTPASIRTSSTIIPYNAEVPDEGETAKCESSIYPLDMDPLYRDFDSFPCNKSPLPLYHTSPTTASSVRLEYGESRLGWFRYEGEN